MASGEKSPIGPNEILAVGLGVAALWRIRQRRKVARAREEAERVRQDDAEPEGRKAPEQA